MHSQKPEWASQTSFIFAASAAAIGLGNIWRFPYLVGENGGGIFVITYLICVVLLALPLLLGEIILGRLGQKNPMATFINLAKRCQHTRLWGAVGLLSVATGFFIATYYVVIGGWVADYTLRVVFGQFAHATQQTSQLAFKQLQNNPYEMLAATTFVLFVSFAINVLGIKNGLERAVRLMFPALLVIMIFLLFYAITTGQFDEALVFLFKPDMHEVTYKTILIALGQAFFSLNIGMGVTIMFSAYLPRKVSTKTATVSIALADTGFALLSGLIIFPIVFAHHMKVSEGPSLIFQTLPMAFGSMQGGSIIGALFFFMLFFAAFSSIIAILETPICWLSETFKLKRIWATFIIIISCWLLSLLTIGSFSHKALFSISDKTYFQHLDFITSGICLPLAGLFTAIFCGWVLKKEQISDYLHWHLDKAWYKIWLILLRYFAPLAIIVILLSSL